MAHGQQLLIYTVVDHVAREMVGGLQVHRHEATAMRSFVDAVLHPDSRLRLHPEDYSLSLIGYLIIQETDNGLLITVENKQQQVITAATILAAQQRTPNEGDRA